MPSDANKLCLPNRSSMVTSSYAVSEKGRADAADSNLLHFAIAHTKWMGRAGICRVSLLAGRHTQGQGE